MAINSYYDYDTDAGIVLSDTSMIRDHVAALFKLSFGQSFVTDSATPAGVLIDSLTLMFAHQAGVIAQNGNGFNLKLATGKWLDGIGVLMGVQRKPATYTTFAYRLKSNEASSVLTYNAKAITIVDAIGQTYHNKYGFNIAPGASMQVCWESDVEGAIDTDTSKFSLAAYSGNIELVQDIRESLAGEDISLGEFVAGTNRESDYAYRVRLTNALSRGTGYSESVTNAISSVAGVTYVKCPCNYKSAYVEQDGIVFTPNSCCIIVRGTLTGQDISDIQSAISSSIPFGCGFVADAGATPHSFQLGGEAGAGYLAYWHEAVGTTITYNIIGEDLLGDRSKEEIASLIQGTITSYTDATNLGVTIVRDDLLTYIQKQVPSVHISSFTMTKETETTPSTSISLPISSYAVNVVDFEFSA